MMVPRLCFKVYLCHRQNNILLKYAFQLTWIFYFTFKISLFLKYSNFCISIASFDWKIYGFLEGITEYFTDMQDLKLSQFVEKIIQYGKL